MNESVVCDMMQGIWGWSKASNVKSIYTIHSNREASAGMRAGIHESVVLSRLIVVAIALYQYSPNTTGNRAEVHESVVCDMPRWMQGTGCGYNIISI